MGRYVEGRVVEQTFTGTLTELGGQELGKSGNEKPRKVVIKDDPDAQYGKTFRCWSNSGEWEQLQGKLGQEVTVEYVDEQFGSGDKTWTSHNITSVLGNGQATENSWGTPPPEEAPKAVTQRATTASVSTSKAKNDDDRTAEIEAAWAVKAILDRTPSDTEIKPDELKANAIRLVKLKREVAKSL